jgi:hypothetical protein
VQAVGLVEQPQPLRLAVLAVEEILVLLEQSIQVVAEVAPLNHHHYLTMAQLAAQVSSSSNIPIIILSLTAQDLPSQLQHQALSKSQHLPQALAQLVSRRKGNNDNQLNANRLHRRQDFCG